jgi:nicotinate-nucleotide adenylyltransferase
VLGVFGGTFDPVHKGHIQMALSALSCLELDRVHLIPCHRPPHRGKPQLTSEERLYLLSLAVAGHKGLVVDDRELKRSGLSWTVDTLKDLRRELGEHISIVLLMGADAYSSLTRWHYWQELPQLAHIGVFLRPGYALPDEGVLADWLNASSAGDESVINVHSRASGCILALNQPQIELSATDIRQQLALGLIPEGLEPYVRDYIVSKQLYGFDENR